MAEVLDRLEQEHTNMAKPVDVLEHRLAVFAEAGTVDYDLILRIVDYFLDYPDQVHHPKEDLVYRKLRERAPGGDGQRGDHRDRSAKHSLSP